MAVWLGGVVGDIKEVDLHRARLVRGWVTVTMTISRLNSWCGGIYLGM